ncbi:MAG: N-acetylmuramoyl-L-alanine amidase [Clostridia bacterium]|nr:N-acetylmuramoyl-L-alanine amidase [Clostridia bacterium]
MAKHGRKPEKRIRWKPIIAVLCTILVLLSLCVATTYFGALDAIATLFSTSAGDKTTQGSTTQTTTTATTTTAAPLLPQHNVPEEMKGAWLTPGVDYLTTDKATAKTVKQQIDTAFSSMGDWQFNTLLLPLFQNGKAVYPSQIAEQISLEGESFDPIAYIFEKAKEQKLFVYGILDLHVCEGEDWNPRTAAGKDRIIKLATEVATRYQTDGFFLSGFSFERKQLTAEEKPAAKDALNQLMPAVVKAITDVNRNAYIGLLSNGIWAHRSVDERGSETGSYYEEFTDGCADTLSWVEQGLFHCVMAEIGTSTAHPTASFQKILSWWSSVAEKQKLPLYVSHAAYESGSYRVGWKSTDQLAQQYLYCKDATAWRGSVYRSLRNLTGDKTGISETLKRAYAGTLDEEFIYKQLTLSFPTKTEYTTKESSIRFQGGGDKNFPLLVNGNAVELSEHGFFSLNQPLSVGKNTFTFSHKGTTKTYTVIYKQTLLNAVSPNADMQVEGGNVFIIRAVANKNATVKASVGNTKLTLTAVETKEDEGGNMPTDFSTFEATFTLPAGKIGSTVDLGNVVVTASLNGLTETKSGGKVKINALPVPTTTTTTTTITTPAPPVGNQKVAQVTAEYAETFSGGGLVDDYSRPYNSYLPKGTCDYVVGTVYNGNFSYYLLASGKRIYVKDAALLQATLANTALQNLQTQLTATHTVFRFTADWQIPVYIRAKEQKYYKDITDKKPNYGIESYSQTATYVELEFHYLSAVPPLPDIQNSPLFSKATWLAGEKPGVYILRLDLKKKGAFYGFMPQWNDKTLTISFLNPVNISQNPPEQRLKGVRILLDPGHGTPDDKPWEAPFNLAYAFTLREKLEALGATVDMTRTTPLTQTLSLQQRVAQSRRNDYHLVISVHMNGYDGTATGATVHYYTEYAYTVSSSIYQKMHAVEVEYGVGTTANGRPRNSGTAWDTLYMTRSIFHCPSILLECAFLDNTKDKEALVDPIYRDKLMQAVTDGVVNYFNAMQ